MKEILPILKEKFKSRQQLYAPFCLTTNWNFFFRQLIFVVSGNQGYEMQFKSSKFFIGERPISIICLVCHCLCKTKQILPFPFSFVAFFSIWHHRQDWCHSVFEFFFVLVNRLKPGLSWVLLLTTPEINLGSYQTWMVEIFCEYYLKDSMIDVRKCPK